MARYGGNTSCVGVVGREGTMLVLDAGTGIRRLAASIPKSVRRIDILLTHLHMDHIQGLGFFAPLYNPEMEVHIWGPGSAVLRLKARLMRYLSPPLFPVNISELRVQADRARHAERGLRDRGVLRKHRARLPSGPTVGIASPRPKGVLRTCPTTSRRSQQLRFPCLPREWTSGGSLAAGADLLIHDSQYSAAEYPGHCGWGHSSLDHTLDFGTLTA
jgi:ribonuclease BN (tRNA processing enzyme)